MRFFSRLFGRRPPALVRLEGDRTFAVGVHGTRHYQQVIVDLVGSGLRSGQAVEAQAVLHCDDDNPHDERAVIVTLGGEIAGHLDPVDAARHRRRLRDRGRPDAPACCTALIVRGRARQGRRDGTFSVWLDWPAD